MAGEGNADGKWSKKKMEEDDALRTVECLRGRLLAERVASTNAKELAEQMGNKLIELEKKLKEETKSRNRAQKKLKYLLKKLESRNIQYDVSDESEESSLLEKSEISSVSSQASSSSKQLNAQIYNSPKSSLYNKLIKSEETPEKLKRNDIENSPNCKSPDSPFAEESSSSSFEINSPDIGSQGYGIEELAELTIPKQVSVTSEETNSGTNNVTPAQNLQTAEEIMSSSDGLVYSDGCCEINSSPVLIKEDPREYKVETSSQVVKIDGETHQNEESNVDDSLALVVVDLPKTDNKIIDPVVLDTNVREVLGALRHAKEKLQTSMERRHMIRVG